MTFCSVCRRLNDLANLAQIRDRFGYEIKVCPDCCEILRFAHPNMGHGLCPFCGEPMAQHHKDRELETLPTVPQAKAT